MKTLRNLAAAVLLLLSVTSCADDRLTLTGTITGMPEGCRLTLANYDQDIAPDSVPTYADVEATENFTINAQLDGPTMLRLTVTRYNQAYDRQAPVASVSFMAGNEKVKLGKVSFTEFVKYTNEETSEENIGISGGKAQKEYEEYTGSVRPVKAALAKLWEEGGEMLMDASFGIIPEDNDSVKMYAARLEALEKKLEKANKEFVSSHPDYAVSALFISRDLNSTYKYTEGEIDSLVTLAASNPDKHRMEIIRRNASKAKKHALGKALGNEEVTMADGTVSHLQDLLNKDGLTLIDCWASWCGPCRMAIPRLKEMNAKYAGKLGIVSISCDRKDADWRRAMAEENMPWPQATVTGAQLDPFVRAYDITTIPRLILVENGRIAVATNDPKEIEARVAERAE